MPLYMMYDVRTLFTNKTIAANSYDSGSYEFSTINGYTAIGVLGVYIYNSASGGVNSSQISWNACYLSAKNKVYMQLRNHTNSAAKIDCKVHILFRKNL